MLTGGGEIGVWGMIEMLKGGGEIGGWGMLNKIQIKHKEHKKLMSPFYVLFALFQNW